MIWSDQTVRRILRPRNCRQGGLTRKDLEPLIGHRGRVAEVLNRKRGLSIDMIRNLHDRPGISADVLIRPKRGEEAA